MWGHVLLGGRRAAAIALAATLALSGCGGSPAALPAAALGAPDPQPQPARARVVIFSIDGLRPDALSAAGAANIGGLVGRGAYTFSARTIMPAITLPSHASMLSGFPPSSHGITWNDYDPARGPIPVPTVFALARAAGLRTVMVVGKEKFRQLEIPGSVERFVLTGPGDEAVAAQAVAHARVGFDLMFVHFPETDLTGHARGWMSPDYLAAVAGADQALGRVMDALPPNTTVIVTADHGGHGNTHGSNVASDVNIPWIVAGPNVSPRVLSRRVSTMDTAATALHVLGLRLPSSATGQTVTEAFDVDVASATAAAAYKRAAGF